MDMTMIADNITQARMSMSRVMRVIIGYRWVWLLIDCLMSMNPLYNKNHPCEGVVDGLGSGLIKGLVGFL